MAEPLLEVRNLKVEFRTRKQALTATHDVSFDVFPATTLGIVGESGCGKSVTATSILRLLPRETSRVCPGSVVRLHGKDLLEMSDREFRQIRGNKISMIFQDPMTALNPVYTIGDQLIEMLTAHRHMKRSEAFERGVEMLEKMGIPSPRQRMKEYPHQLSGGMRQRVMIAMALSCDPELLIADEPTTALDVTIQAQILELMGKLKEQFHTAIMLITHDMGVIAEMADEVMVMYAGEVVEYAPVTELFDHPRHPYTQGLLRSIPRLDQDAQELYTIEGTVPGLNEMPEGCRFAGRCPYATEHCCASAPPLREAAPGIKVRCWRCGEEA